MVFLREVTLNDLDLLYEWANDSDVRQYSFCIDHIPYETHIKWFHKMICDRNIVQYILMDDHRPVGQIRIKIENEEAEVSYSISPEHRGRGYGHIALELLYKKVLVDYPKVKSLIARVKPENEISSKVFLEEGYEMRYMCYEKSIDSDGNTRY